MIKFFRRIRHNLFTESLSIGQSGKFSKYLIYAFGEIILVVIGILIALSINNWNNDKLKAKEEVSLLQDMLIDLKQNINVSNSVLDIHDDALKKNIDLRYILLKKYTEVDSLPDLIRSLRFSATPTFSVSTYKTISQSGLNIIRSDTLRKSILNYYEVVNPYVNNKSNEDPKNQFQTLLFPYYKKYFKIKLDSDDSIIPGINNSSDMFNDNEFIIELHSTVNKRKRLMNHLNLGKNTSETLIKEINQYLNQNQ